MKTILLSAAALTLTATAAAAGGPIPLNSDGERKYDYASRLQAERGEGPVSFSSRNKGGLDFTATQAIDAAPAGNGIVSVRRTDDGNDGTIIEFSHRDAQGNRVVFRTSHYPN